MRICARCGGWGAGKMDRPDWWDVSPVRRRVQFPSPWTIAAVTMRRGGISRHLTALITGRRRRRTVQWSMYREVHLRVIRGIITGDTGGGVDGKQSYGRQTVPAEAETGRR
ncbi:putative protein [Salmonella enterica subsp. enterica serovar Typhimurium str. DT104]|nr:putative protein [Salmonella enterica subsp. enterica serovar Typhimurium str. DT104]